MFDVLKYIAWFTTVFMVIAIDTLMQPKPQYTLDFESCGKLIHNQLYYYRYVEKTIDFNEA